MALAPVASMAVAALAVALAPLESLGTGSALGGAAAREPLRIAAVPAAAPAAPAVALSAAILVLAAGFAPDGRLVRLLAPEEALQPSKESARRRLRRGRGALAGTAAISISATAC